MSWCMWNFAEKPRDQFMTTSGSFEGNRATRLDVSDLR